MKIKQNIIVGLACFSISSLALADCFQENRSCEQGCTITSIGIGLLTGKYDGGKSALDGAEKCLNRCKAENDQCERQEEAEAEQQRRAAEARVEEERRRKEQAEREAQAKLAVQQSPTSQQQTQFASGQPNYTIKNGKVLVNAGKCGFYSKTPPAGRVQWFGPCVKGLANGEGVMRYYTADNKIFLAAKDNYQGGKYKSTKESFFISDGKVMHKSGKTGAQEMTEVPSTTLPDWASESYLPATDVDNSVENRDGMWVTTKLTTSESVLQEKCNQFYKLVSKKGAPPYCSGNLTPGVLSSYYLTDKNPDTGCRIIPENGLDKRFGAAAQNLGRGYRQWFFSSFEIHGNVNKCKNFRAFASVVGVAQDSGWIDLGSPIPGKTYYVSYALPVDGRFAPEKTPELPISRYPTPDNYKMNFRVCRTGTPLNNCALNAPSNGLPRAKSGIAPDILELASYDSEQTPDSSNLSNYNYSSNKDGCKQAYAEIEQFRKAGGMLSDVNNAYDICKSVSAKIEHFRELTERVNSACGRDSREGKTSNALLDGYQQGYGMCSQNQQTGKGGGSSDQCKQAAQRMQNELSQIQTESPCPLMKAQLAIFEKYRPIASQSCAGQPDYDATMNNFNTQISSYQNTMSQMGCR